MFDLECFVELKNKGAKFASFHQCMFGAPSTKPTRFLYWNGRFDTVEVERNRPQTVQIAPGKWTAHPAVVGIKGDDGKYKTRFLSAYPDELNRRIAAIIHLLLSQPRPS